MTIFRNRTFHHFKTDMNGERKWTIERLKSVRGSEAFRKSDELIGKVIAIGLKTLQKEIRPNSVQKGPPDES